MSFLKDYPPRKQFLQRLSKMIALRSSKVAYGDNTSETDELNRVNKDVWHMFDKEKERLLGEYDQVSCLWANLKYAKSFHHAKCELERQFFQRKELERLKRNAVEKAKLLGVKQAQQVQEDAERRKAEYGDNDDNV